MNGWINGLKLNTENKSGAEGSSSCSQASHCYNNVQLSIQVELLKQIHADRGTVQ